MDANGYRTRDTDEQPWTHSVTSRADGTGRLSAIPLGRALQDRGRRHGVGIILWLGLDVPLLAWLALIFVCGAAVRLGQGVVELTLVTPDESRPALRVVDASVRAGLMWTVKVLGLLAAVQVLLSALLSGILGADAVTALFTGSIVPRRGRFHPVGTVSRSMGAPGTRRRMGEVGTSRCSL